MPCEAPDAIARQGHGKPDSAGNQDRQDSADGKRPEIQAAPEQRLLDRGQGTEHDDQAGDRDEVPQGGLVEQVRDRPRQNNRSDGQDAGQDHVGPEAGVQMIRLQVTPLDDRLTDACVEEDLHQRDHDRYDRVKADLRRSENARQHHEDDQRNQVPAPVLCRCPKGTSHGPLF
jgi:hypothetical protein